jgi:hypothetical protein
MANEEYSNTFRRLTPRGLALCDFAFKDGLAAGLSKDAAYETAQELIKEWDGSETLLQMYQRTIQRHVRKIVNDAIENNLTFRELDEAIERDAKLGLWNKPTADDEEDDDLETRFTTNYLTS